MIRQAFIVECVVPTGSEEVLATVREVGDDKDGGPGLMIHFHHIDGTLMNKPPRGTQLFVLIGEINLGRDGVDESKDAR